MRKLAVCGAEKEYVKRLSESFRGICGKDTEVLLFTEEDALRDYLMTESLNICIALEDFKIPDGRIESVVYLSEEENEPGKVFRYMPYDRIYSEAMALSADTSDPAQQPYAVGKKELIGIYTPIKRSFQTTFALTLGQILSGTRKVLYLNFESFSGFDTLSSRLGGSDLMDLLYFSECEDSNFSYRVDSLKERMGELDYISPAKAFVKFSFVTKAQWIKLVDTLIDKTDYEVIILDLSENVNGLLDILAKCSYVYTITDADRAATAKLAQYENLLRESEYKDILEKTENIRVPKLREIPHNYELLPHTELADYVRRLIRYDMGGDADE